MSLSSTNQILSSVLFDNNDFSFVNTYGSMILNRPYSKGFKKFSIGKDTRDAFLYKALSAVTDEIGNVLYLNIKKYIDFVSDVDVCKIKSLKSMLQLFGFNKTIFDNLENLPKELIDLINVLSINKKLLLRDGVVTKELLLSLMESDGRYYTDADEAVYLDEYKINFRKYFQNNSYTLSASLGCTDSDNCSLSKLNGIYVYTGLSLSNYYDVEDWIDEATFSELSSSDIYRSSNGYFAIHENDSYMNFYNNEFKPLLKIKDSFIKDVLTANGDTYTLKIEDLITVGDNSFYEYNGDRQFIEKNINQTIDIIFRNLDYTEDVTCIDDNKYLSYLSTLYKTFIRGLILKKYNAEFSINKRRTELYIYPYLGSMYFDDDIKQSNQMYNGFEMALNDILSIKMFNHVPKSFNEKKIVDDIDEGVDSLDNYSGALLSILQIEIHNRAAPLDYTKVGITGNTSKQLQTRYSYYREKKVAEYANFVDNYYSTIQINPNIYDFDSNYYVIQNQSRISTVIDLNLNLKKLNPDDDVDPSGEMIGTVAMYLARFTLYIAKVREKIKLQTLKNYMKGTNLLMIYVINEYLNEYAAHNKDFFEDDDLLLSIYNALDGHLFADRDSEYTILIDEFYDLTNYFNISTHTSLSSTKQYADEVNDRYWELTSVERPIMMSADGFYYKQAEIDKLYLSTLNMQNLLGGASDPKANRNLANFLSTIYDLGANDSFVYDLSGDPQLSIFSTMLKDKTHAADIYERLLSLSSAYTSLNKEYLSAEDYKYPNDIISNLISNMTLTYVFTNLSNEYLKDVSAVYNKHIGTLNKISNDVVTLSTSYQDFISGKYSFYYKKSNSKYCYSDHDIDAGIYLHDYYVGNDMYDNAEMNLYEHLYLLQQYSVEQNIHNFALSDAIAYVRENFYDISNRLKTNVVQPLVVSGFIDYDPLTLDDKLQYVYDYILNYIQDRKDILKNLLTSLQQQASNLKTQYETLNNTFTAAVASYEDNDDGYKLGDSEISAVSLTKGDGDYKWTRTDAGDIPKNSEYLWLYCKYNDRWYASKPGDYPVSAATITPYNPEDTLLNRIDQLSAYMSTPTAFDTSREYTGLFSEGTKAVCDNVKQGVEDILKAFDNLCTQANALYGINADEFASVDLYDLILDMITALTSIDQAMFDSDSIVVSYNKYKKLVLELSSLYLPIKQAYTGIYTDSEQSEYLIEFYPNTDLTKENLDSLERYMKKKDAENFDLITISIDKFITVDFLNIIIAKDELEQAINDDGVRVTYTSGNAIEQYLEDINNALIADVANKVLKALNKILFHQNIVNGYLDIITNEISASLEDTLNFDICVKLKLSELNFFDHDIYKSWVDLFLTYGGRSFCYDPYYNMRNVTHPSYLIHPFIWNFVKKIQGDSLIGTGFKSKIVTDLIDGQGIEKLKRYIGKFGLTIDTWRNYTKGLIDYSGYITRWEQSEHASPNTGMFNLIVDYEGAFYPPALKEYIIAPNPCISSVYYKKTKVDIQLDIERILTADISSYAKVNKNGIISSNTFYNAIAGTLNSYCISNNVKQLVDAKVNGKVLSALQIDDVLVAAADGIPYTFFENYYKHLNLKTTQYLFIGLLMKEYYNEIKDVTSSRHLAEQYDIYKYGLDASKNSYILFKKYDYSILEEYEDMTFRLRRNTLGRMWIRLAHTPLAFPAFSGERPQYYIKMPSMISIAIMKLILLKPNSIEYTDKTKTKIKKINNDMCYFYDFEITQDKLAISYVTFNGDFNELGNFYKQFELSWVVSDSISLYYDIDDDLEYLVFKNDASNNIDYIDFRPSNGMIASYRNLHDIADLRLLSEGVRYPSLVGYYVHDLNCIDFVYVYKKYLRIVDEEGDVHYNIVVSGKDDDKITENTVFFHDLNPVFFVVQVKSGVGIRIYPSSGGEEMYAFRSLGKYPYDHNVCVGYDKTLRHLVFAITTVNEEYMKNVVTETSKENIDFNVNTEGAVIDDPIAYEMNSHDMFNLTVTLVNYKRKLSEITYVNCYDYNMNADMSYLPSYPGISGEAEIYKKYKDYQQYNIELLGMSKDIEYLINLVNPNPNPYITYDSILSSVEFGRVYEDFVREDDKAFIMFTSPSLNDNMPQSVDETYTTKKDSGLHCFILTYNLYNVRNYTVKDIKNMNLLIFNLQRLGKNPYYVGNLSALLEETELVYNDKIEDDNNAEYDIANDYNGINIVVTGTHDKVGTRSIQDSNYINNITKITALLVMGDVTTTPSGSGSSSGSSGGGSYEFSFIEFVNTDYYTWGILWDKTLYHKITHNLYQELWKSIGANPALIASALLVIKFYYDEFEPYVFVPEGAINVALYNAYDLTMFKYYHMLDAHGAVNCKYLSSALDGYDVDNYSWGIVYDLQKFEGNEVSDLMRSWYINEYGGKTYLADIELSDYDYLSDVYILQGNKRLGFKYDEELRFDLSNDLYYYPTLNISYPLRATDFIIHGGAFSLKETDTADILTHVFNEYNMFIIDLDKPADVISSIGEVDIPYIYNDINDVRAFEDYLSAGLDGRYNYAKYDTVDTRSFQYVHFVTLISAPSTTLNVPDSQVMNKSIDLFLNYCYTELSGLCPKKSEELTADYETLYITILPTIENCNISKQLKLYVNYRRNKDDSNKIDLYFNYFNYFDSPYVKIENGTLILLDTIPGTYLKLQPGEDGILDIVLLFKFYISGILYGYKNAKVLSYRIFNLSDDKPKFMILKIYQASPGEQKYSMQEGFVKFNIEAHDIDLDLEPAGLILNYSIFLNVTSNKTLKQVDLYIDYPDAILQPLTSGNGYSVIASDSIAGLLHVKLDNISLKNYLIQFKTSKSTDYLDTYANKSYMFSVLDPNVEIEEDSKLKVECNAVYFKLVKASLLSRDPKLLKAKDEDVAHNSPGWLATLDVLDNLVLLN